MKVIFEEIDGAYYQEIWLSEDELNELLMGFCVENRTRVGYKNVYTGIKAAKSNHQEEADWLQTYSFNAKSRVL